MSAQQDSSITAKQWLLCVSPSSSSQMRMFMVVILFLIHRRVICGVWRSGADNFFQFLGHLTKKGLHPHKHHPDTLDSELHTVTFGIWVSGKSCATKSGVLEAESEIGVWYAECYQGSMPAEGRERRGKVKLPCNLNRVSVNPIRAVPHYLEIAGHL